MTTFVICRQGQNNGSWLIRYKNVNTFFQLTSSSRARRGSGRKLVPRQEQSMSIIKYQKLSEALEKSTNRRADLELKGDWERRKQLAETISCLLSDDVSHYPTSSRIIFTNLH